MEWLPSPGADRLRERAELLASLRSFFHQRQVMEVETPLLCTTGVTDPSIEPLIVSRGEALSTPRYLQTSPEYAMKRLLANGCGPIFQIARAFRDGESGARHNPEFSILEWYRPGFDMPRLMQEVVELLHHCLGGKVFPNSAGVRVINDPALPVYQVGAAAPPGARHGDLPRNHASVERRPTALGGRGAQIAGRHLSAAW